MTVLLKLCLELVQTPHQINDKCVLLLRCQLLDVGHLRHAPHYAHPGSSLQALNSYAAAKKSRQKKAAHTASPCSCPRAPNGPTLHAPAYLFASVANALNERLTRFAHLRFSTPCQTVH